MAEPPGTAPDTDVQAGADAAGAVVAAAERLRRAYVEQVRERLAASHGGAELGDQLVCAQQVARAACDIDAARLQISASLGAGRAQALRAQRQAVSRARDVADQLLASSRRHALDVSDPVTGCWCDVHAGCRRVFGLLDALG